MRKFSLMGTCCAIMVLCVMVFSVGCEVPWDDDDDKNTTLTGIWIATGIELTTTSGQSATETLGTDAWAETMTFNEDGTWSYTSTIDGRTASGTGTYSAADNTLSINGGDTMTYSIAGSTLTLSGVVAEGTYGIKYQKN